MKKNGLMGELVAEAFGTFILILLGDGVVANVGLAPRLAAPAYAWTTITFGWAFAVVVAVYVAGGVTGAHINPAVTLAGAVKRGFPWAKVIPYWIAQVVGAFLGAFGVFLCYRDGLVAAGMPNVWCTGPGSIFGQAFWGGTGGSAIGTYSLLTCFICEIFGTAMLIWGVYAVVDTKNVGPGVNLWPLLVGFVVLAVGLSLGGPSGYAINPARDFGPRLFGLLVGTAGLFTGLYWLVAPILGTLIGGVLGAFTYDWFITPYLPEK
ncbi:MAG: aquaporin family protein [Chloroflexi bacterium]|nr:aquaporin family protein [Chloroflexota bacterium]